MNFFKTWGKILVYPVIRARKDVSSSYGNIKETMAALREKEAQRVVDAEASTKYLQGLTDAEKFAEVVELNEWTEAGLKKQKIAVKRTRHSIVAVGVISLFFQIYLMFVAPLYLIVLLGFSIIIFVAYIFSMATRYAWWEYQLESKALLTMKTFLSRRDLISRVLL